MTEFHVRGRIPEDLALIRQALQRQQQVAEWETLNRWRSASRDPVGYEHLLYTRERELRDELWGAR